MRYRAMCVVAVVVVFLAGAPVSAQDDPKQNRGWCKLDGSEFGELALDLHPFEYRQPNNVFGGTGVGELSGGYAVVTSSSPEARYFAYASIVDNLSGDAIYVPAR